MSKKQKQTIAGRPTKTPKGLEKLTVVQTLVEDVRAIFKECGILAGDADIGLIINFMMFPNTIDAVKITKDESGINYELEIDHDLAIKTKGKTIAVSKATLAALHFAKLFALAPDQMVAALPKIEKMMLTYFSSARRSLIRLASKAPLNCPCRYARNQSVIPSPTPPRINNSLSDQIQQKGRPVARAASGITLPAVSAAAR